MRYLIKIKYDGSKFYGFQRLNNYPTVQKSIEDALFKICKKKIEIKGSGRTDRGVHAYSQMAHFDLGVDIPPDNLRRAINRLLNNYIYIDDCQIVDNFFHARFNVVKKTYLYKINLGKYDPLKVDYTYYCNYDLDIQKMKEASKLFLGIHNFENFVSGKRDNYEAIIYDINFNIQDHILEITFKGKSFYRYMVRSLVGALIDVGRKKVNLQDIELSLNKKTTQRFSIAPSAGLYLMDIKY